MYLYGTTAAVASTGLANGNFEIDSDADGVPDGWSFTDNHATTYPGGTVALETTSPLEGAKSIKMVHPGGASNGGGLVESDYVPCSLSPVTFSFLHKVSQVGAKCQVILYWYDASLTPLGGGSASTIVYSSTAGPTSASRLIGQAIPPSGARYYTVGLVGGYTDTNPGSSTTIWFDEISGNPVESHQAAPPPGLTAIGTGTGSFGYVDCTSATTTHNTPFKNCFVRLTGRIKVGSIPSGTNFSGRIRSGSYYSTAGGMSTTGTTEHVSVVLVAPTDSNGDLVLYNQFFDSAAGAWGVVFQGVSVSGPVSLI